MTHSADRPPARPRARAQTLIELIVTIVVIGILAGVAGVLIVWPIQRYTMLAARSDIVDDVEMALRRMARDLHAALPNSVRVTDPGTGGNFAIELLPVMDGGKYNVKVNAACNKLAANNVDYEFDMHGQFRNAATRTASGIRLVVNNRGVSGYDVYADAGAAVGTAAVVTPLALTISFNPSPCPGRPPCSFDPANDHACLVEGHRFKGDSPNQRLYVVTTPVSYLCDAAAGTLKRYFNYAIQGSQPTTAAAFAALNASSALVVPHVSACRAVSTSSDVRNRGLVTLTLGLTDKDQTARLIRQVVLDNSR